MLRYTVIVCISLIVIFSLTSLALWLKPRRNQTEEEPKKHKLGWKVSIDWKWPIAVVICEALLAVRFPVQYWALARNPWFWVTHIVGGVVFVFFREQDKKSNNKEEVKLTTSGKLILASLALVLLANLVGVSPNGSGPSDTTYSLHNILAANNPFGDGRPEENKEMRAAAVKFWQDNLPDDIDGQQFLIRMADQASRFNQFGFDGKTPLSRKANGREKVGIMGIDRQLWSEVGNGFPTDGSAEQNMAVAKYLYQKYKSLPWSWPGKIHPSSIIILVSAATWTEYVRTSRSARLYMSGNVEIREKGNNAEYLAGENLRATLPPAESLSFKSASGRPEIVVLNN